MKNKIIQFETLTTSAVMHTYKTIVDASIDHIVLERLEIRSGRYKNHKHNRYTVRLPHYADGTFRVSEETYLRLMKLKLKEEGV